MPHASVQELTVASIVAIHGLSSANTESHGGDTWTSKDQKKVWLSELVPLNCWIREDTIKRNSSDETLR